MAGVFCANWVWEGCRDGRWLLDRICTDGVGGVAECCGRRQLPQSRAVGARQHAADAVAAAREPWGCTAGTASLGNDFRPMVIPSAERNSAITWISQYLAPSRGSCREAEGVAFHPQKFSHVAHSHRGQIRDSSRAERGFPSADMSHHYRKSHKSPKQKIPRSHRTGGFSYILNFPNPLPSTPASSTPAESAAAARNASSARLFLPNARSTPGRTRARKCWTHTRA